MRQIFEEEQTSRLLNKILKSEVDKKKNLDKKFKEDEEIRRKARAKWELTT